MRCEINIQIEKKEITAIVCNMCGKKIEVIHGVPQEDVLDIEKTWGYFSRKDGKRHQFDLCEDCYDSLVRSFQIPVETE